MQDHESLSQLIGDVYDAALNPALWTGALERATSFVRGYGAGLFVHDSVRRTANLRYHYGVTAHYLQLYFEKYANSIRWGWSITASMSAM
jgi:hypothetical protein